jgi:hypothetical protein
MFPPPSTPKLGKTGPARTQELRELGHNIESAQSGTLPTGGKKYIRVYTVPSQGSDLAQSSQESAEG